MINRVTTLCHHGNFQINMYAHGWPTTQNVVIITTTKVSNRAYTPYSSINSQVHYSITV